ncbi:Sca4 family protein [Rickettsia bellii]|uniref:Uncharacterized protein n=1 Tax=Rickettsia bellii (strain RML369-C) TaxID=336407 RepID=Q1RJ37_RICBR|nr:Sca4 family protein [Rickettsia bellii]ABE04627.1 unknown [Rickettsia bellii RML369-C]
MSKSDNHNYLDKNETIICTANNLYKEALEFFNNIRNIEQNQGVTALVKKGYIAARIELTQSLLFGKIEACSGLAVFNQQGIGGPISPYNQKLFLVIGSKLGYQACKQALAQLPNNNYNVEQEANVWVNHINTYKRDLNKEITTPELSASSIFLKNDLKKNNISFDAYNTHFNILSIDEELETNYTPTPSSSVNQYEHNPPPVPKRAESKQEATGLKSFFKGMFSKAPEASTAPKAALVPVVAPKVTSSNISYRDILLRDQEHPEIALKLQEATINTNLTIRVNGQHIFEVKQYRAVKIPNALENIKTPTIKFVFSYLNGVKLSDEFAIHTKGTAHLKLDYNANGRLEKLTLPNQPIYFKDKPGYPAFCIFKKIMCSLPVDSGQLGHLMQIAPKVEFNNVDEYTYKVELLG